MAVNLNVDTAISPLQYTATTAQNDSPLTQSPVEEAQNANVVLDHVSRAPQANASLVGQEIRAEKTQQPRTFRGIGANANANPTPTTGPTRDAPRAVDTARVEVQVAQAKSTELNPTDAAKSTSTGDVVGKVGDTGKAVESSGASAGHQGAD